MDINVLRMIVTVLSFTSFLAIAYWAWKSSNRQRFEDLSRICIGIENDRIGGRHE